jgi:hypothetical protein
LQSACSVGTWVEREHEWVVAAAFPEGNRFAGP